MRDEEAKREFARLYRDHSSAIKRYALRRLDNVANCDDLVSETFLVAWRRWDDVPAPDRRLPWLYGIAYRNLSNMRRSRDRQHRLGMRLTFERDFTDEADDQGVSVAHVQRAIARLRASDRELLEFVYWEKLTYRDIATIIGISENAVGIRVNRARKHLRSILSLSTDDGANPNRREEFES